MFRYAAPPWSFAATSTPQTNHFSSIHQEKSYLLNTLAAEESHAERLLKALDSRRAELKDMEEKGDTSEKTVSTRKAIGGINRKLKRCYKLQKATTDSLANVSMRMQEAEQMQWRLSKESWAQQTQDHWLNTMQAAMQGLSIGESVYPPASPYPPATPYLRPHYIPLSPAPPFVTSPIGLYDGLGSTHQTPVSPHSGQNSTANLSCIDSPMSPLYTPFYASSFDGPYYNPPPMPSPGHAAQQIVSQAAESVPPPYVDESQESMKVRQLRRLQPNRALSAPDVITRRRASALSGLHGIGDKSDKVKGDDSLGPGRPSLVGGPDTDIGLHR